MNADETNKDKNLTAKPTKIIGTRKTMNSIRAELAKDAGRNN